jgi:hypothetical protein
MMQSNKSKHILAAKFCLLVLVAMLLLVACGNGYSSPGSPQATPTKSGYSIIYLLDHEMHVLLAPQRR